MTTIKIAELKDGLSATLRDVQQGARIIVTDRDRPIALLIPIDDEDGVTVVPPKRPFSAVRDKRYVGIRTKLDVLELLRIERGER